MHHHLVEVRSAKEKDDSNKRRSLSCTNRRWHLMTIHAMMMMLNKLCSSPTESIKLERVFWFVLSDPFRNDHVHEASLTDVRMFWSGWFWHTCRSMLLISTFMHPFFIRCPQISQCSIGVELYRLQRVFFGMSSKWYRLCMKDQSKCALHTNKK